jgi:cytochrome P450
MFIDAIAPMTQTIPHTAANLPIPPGAFGLPLIGETLSFFRDPQFAQKRHAKYGPIFKTRLFGQPTIFLKGAIANEFVLSNENQLFQVSWPYSTRVLLGQLSLALQTGADHQNRRKLLAQAFLPRALAGYMSTMHDMTQRYVQQWVKLETFRWYPELRNYTFDIACKLLVGLDDGSQTDLGHWFETWCNGLFSLPLPLPWTQFGRAQACRQRLMTQLEAIIRERQQSPNPGDDTLGLLIQARDDEGNQLSLAELKDQVLLLLFAGHETLTSAIASFCLLTAQHPDVLAKLRAEQANFDAAAAIDFDQLKQMTYLEQVLREVLRLIPPVGGGFRSVLKTCELQGYQIPEGWNVLYSIGQTHQDETIYQNAAQFEPDHFNTEQVVARDKTAQKFGYVPFGGGIRECLGKEFARLEMKLFAVTLIRDYDWSLVPGQNLDMVTVPTPHPQDGLQVIFRPRFS